MAKAEPMEYINIDFSVLRWSIALRNMKMKAKRATTPVVSVSKNPRDDLWITEGLRAKTRADSKPTVLPPISLPTRYMMKTESAPRIGAISEQKDIRSIFVPNKVAML